MLLGPHDEAYYQLRARIARSKIAIPSKLRRIATALNQIMDLELAVMLESYREDLLEKNRHTEGLATIGQFPDAASTSERLSI